MTNKTVVIPVVFAIVLALVVFMSVEYSLFLIDALVVIGVMTVLGLVGYWMDRQVDRNHNKDGHSSFSS